MKKIFLVLCLVCALTVTAFATDGEPEAGTEVTESTDIIEQGTTVYVDNDVILTDGQNVLTGVNTYVGNSVTPTDTYGLKSALLAVLGDYDAIIVDYEYQNTANDITTHVREIQPDYVWIASAVILALFVYCLFKMGVAVWKR